jgi:exopolysaccharide biosynthesis protein
VEKTGRKSWELKQGGENNENDVIVLQKALVNRGYLGRLTDDFGTFDTETKNAVMNYQVFNGISPIGIVDKNTWTQLALPWNDLNQEPNRDDFKNYLEILYDDNYDCEPPVIALTQPTDGDIMNTGDSVHIATSGTNCGYIQLFVNGELEETQASNSFEYNYRMNSQGDYSIQIKARNMLSPYKGEIAESEIVTVKVKHYYENITDIEVLPQGYHEFFVNELHSTVYVYITNPATEKITFSIGQPDKHETVSQIASASGLNPIVAMNAGFFDMTMNSVEHFGVLIVNGKELEPVSLKKQKKDDGSYEIVDVYKKRVEEANTFIKWENGTTEIKKITDVDIPYIKENAEWAIGAGYTLLDVKQGIKNNNKAIGNNWSSLYTEWKPRTMLGVKENGEFILAVIEGERDKTKNKKGANAKEEADVMEQLGAVMAINFDGGGSSTFWKEEEGNKFVGENKNGRKIGSIIMVVDK